MFTLAGLFVLSLGHKTRCLLYFLGVLQFFISWLGIFDNSKQLSVLIRDGQKIQEGPAIGGVSSGSFI